MEVVQIIIQFLVFFVLVDLVSKRYTTLFLLFFIDAYFFNLWSRLLRQPYTQADISYVSQSLAQPFIKIYETFIGHEITLTDQQAMIVFCVVWGIILIFSILGHEIDHHYLKRYHVKETIKKMNDIDSKYYDMKINIESIIDILKIFKNYKIKNQNVTKSALTIASGNPYITIAICMKAIIENRNQIIDIEQRMLAVNAILVSIIQKVIKENNKRIEIKIENNVTKEWINDSNIEDIEIIDNIEKYDELKNNIKSIKNIKSIHLLDIELYTDAEEELQELQDTIYDYCTENFIGIEIYKEKNINELINKVSKIGDKNWLVILSKETNITEEEIKQKTKYKKVTINKNPFKEINKTIAENIFK